MEKEEREKVDRLLTTVIANARVMLGSPRCEEKLGSYNRIEEAVAEIRRMIEAE